MWLSKNSAHRRGRHPAEAQELKKISEEMISKLRAAESKNCNDGGKNAVFQAVGASRKAWRKRRTAGKKFCMLDNVC